MALKTFRPTSPGLRHLVLVDRGQLWKGAPIKVLVEGKSKTGGRNNDGRITTRHIGGGAKRSYRLVDFRRRKFDAPGKVERIEYDPNRTAFIALIKYQDGELAYILAPQRLAIGDQVVAGEKVDVKPGNAMPLAGMPIGTIVHNVELKPGRGGQMARSAGSFVQLVGRDSGWAIAEVEFGRDAPGARRVHGDHRRRVEPRPLERGDGQGRPHALEGPSPDRALDRHEPDRSPERRPHQGRQALGDAVGQADQGRQDA